MALIGTGEIQKRSGLTRTQVFRLRQSGDWPDPHTTLEGGTQLWDEVEVREHIGKLVQSGRVVERGDTVALVPRRYLKTASAT